MALDLSSAFRDKNNIKRDLFSEYSSLKFIAINKSLPTKPRQYLGTVTRNWSYKARRDPGTGAVRETIYFVSINPEQYIWADDATEIELVRPNGTFTRFKVAGGGKLEPSPPKYEWEITVRPNEQDTDAI